MSIHTKVGDTWKELSQVCIKVGDAWKTCRQVYVNVNGVWKPCFLTNTTQQNSIGVSGKQSISLSNVQVGSTLTLNAYSCYGYVWLSDDEGGGYDREEAGFSIGFSLSGCYVSYAKFTWRGRIYEANWYTNNGITYVDDDSIWADSGDMLVNFIATSSNVSIAIVYIGTSYSGGQLAYTSSVSGYYD